MLLTAAFDFTINPTLEEALQRGIPLYFVLEVEIVRPRWWWFDDKVATSAVQYRVSWQPLTRQYRVASGLLSQSFDTLAEVERLIGRVNSRGIAQAADLERGARYEAVVRLRLDVNQLPKPFQVNALASRDWQLASELRRIPFVAVSPILSSRYLRWAAADRRQPVGDRAVPARHRELEHAALRARATTRCSSATACSSRSCSLLVVSQLWQLRRKLKRGVFGSRLALRLVFLFALVAVLPGALVYAVSVQFIGRSIESWFDVRVDRALEGGLNARARRARLAAARHAGEGDAHGRCDRRCEHRRGPRALARRASSRARTKPRCSPRRGSSSRSPARPRSRSPPGAADGAGAAPRAPAAVDGRDRAARGRRCCCAWSCRSTAATVSIRSRCCSSSSRCRAASRRRSRRCRPAGATTRRSRSRARR